MGPGPIISPNFFFLPYRSKTTASCSRFIFIHCLSLSLLKFSRSLSPTAGGGPLSLPVRIACRAAPRSGAGSKMLDLPSSVDLACATFLNISELTAFSTRLLGARSRRACVLDVAAWLASACPTQIGPSTPSARVPLLGFALVARGGFRDTALLRCGEARCGAARQRRGQATRVRRCYVSGVAESDLRLDPLTGRDSGTSPTRAPW